MRKKVDKLRLPSSFVELTEEELLSIRGGCYMYGMPKSEYVEILRIINGEGIKTLSDKKLLCFFESVLLNLSNSYNNNMELFTESEMLYEKAKVEILERFNH
jgi:hypothetical protein